MVTMVNLITRAAGVVVVKPSSRGRKILLVHRPRHKDWSLPKGKLEPGESTVAAAIRECDEETGVRPRLGQYLGRHTYRVMGRPKTVDYWAATVGKDQGFTPDDEVDKIAWVTRSQAKSLLSYKRDLTMVDAALSLPPTLPLILLRHTAAVKRGDFKGDDPKRPLTGRGRTQAKSLILTLDAYGINAVHSSDAIRCLNTVAPFAGSSKLAVRREPVFSEVGFERRPSAAVSRLQNLVTTPSGLVLCTHRPVLPAITKPFLAKLPKRQAAKLAEPLKPGEMLIIHRSINKGKMRVIAVNRNAAP